MSVGMPAHLHLVRFGEIVADAFGHHPYHVGSSLEGKQWRDVDVRLILPDEEFETLFGKPGNENERWAPMCMAYAALGREMTGLPIDFQIQQQTDANKRFSRKDGCHRSALGIVKHRYHLVDG